ncbi:MAG: ATP-binding protein [Clostridia bacterium]|nr:ATP-binding protein [Clostridia bacterium]
MADAVVEKIRRQYAALRQRKADEARITLDKANRDEQFFAAEREIKKLDFLIGKAECYDENAEKAKALRALKKEHAAIRKKALRRLGIKESDLTPAPDCELCRDAGFVNGLPCKCFLKRWQDECVNISGIPLKPALRFADDTAEKSEKLEKLYAAMKNYVKKFPDVKTKNLLFMGKSGSGKSHLAETVAGEIYDRGFVSIFVSASALCDMLHTDLFAAHGDKVGYDRLFADCDLLVIDDLGTEKLMRTITVENLCQLISLRQSFARPTIVTTNLSQEEILERYDERIYTRLVEKRNSAVVLFPDENFRI